MPSGGLPLRIGGGRGHLSRRGARVGGIDHGEHTPAGRATRECQVRDTITELTRPERRWGGGAEEGRAVALKRDFQQVVEKQLAVWQEQMKEYQERLGHAGT